MKKSISHHGLRGLVFHDHVPIEIIKKKAKRDELGKFARGGRVAAEKALPPNHQLGMKVPRGGSMCANCRFLASPTTCGNQGFIKWNGGPKLPHPAHEYCCDNYQIGRKRADGGSVRKPGATYNTQLSPLDEMAYRQWVKDNNVPTNPDATAPQDYDMRGFWQGLQQQNPRAQSAIDPNDSRLHYPDYWKTPLHETFSNESQWAPANAPQWTDDDKLVAPSGRVLFDDRNRPSDAEKLLTIPSRADGGSVDDLSDADKAAMMPETFVNPLVKQKTDRLLSLPQRAIGAAQHYTDTGEYNPGPILESASLAMQGGTGGVPMRNGETALGSGPIRARYDQALAEGRITPAEHQGFIEALGEQTAGLAKKFSGKQPNISDIIKESGLPKEDVHKWLLDEAKAGRVTLHPTTSVHALAPEVASGAMNLPGFNEPFVNAYFKPKRASGGSVQHMADGGIPSFDQTQPVDSGPPPFEATQPVAPDVGGFTAAMSGAEQGATFGFADELKGLYGAGPQIPSAVKAIPFVGPAANVAQPVIGAARMAKEYLMGGDQTATTAYQKARDEARAADELAKQQHPYLHMAGELAGSIPAMAVLPEGEFVGAVPLAKNVLKGAQVGAEYGGLSGLGEGKDIGDSAMKSAEGIVGGIVGGAAAPVVGAAGSKLVDRFVSPAVGAIRGWINPEAEASRRLAAALQKDQELIAAGKADGMSPTDWINSRQAGEPVTLADLGSSNTQALLRSSANTSPEGRAILEKALNDRFYGQSERVANEVRGLVAGGANAGKTADDLVSEYNRTRVPAYKQAYQEGDKEIVSPAIERLMGSPTFEQAMKNAVSTGKDRAVAEGYGAFNPGVTIENGLIKFKTGPKGVPQYPNLQYWDAVKKELDSMASVAKRQGDTSSVAGNLATTLRNELDQQVPSYANARGIAAQYFGENNALEAGQKLAGKKVDPAQITQVMQKMQPTERDLFREGYASDWANRVISNISDTRDITKAMFNSPNERARALAVFGPAGMAKMEARMSLETIMDGARKAMGNSTTARQLIEAGLAGGVLEGYLSGWDPTRMAEGAAGAAGARKFLGTEMAAGARKFVGKVDAKTARMVAELLTSNDPAKLAQGMRMAQKNQRISDGLKNIANRVALAGQQQVAPSGVGSAVRAIQGPMPVGASQEQQ